jgi:hypothetical protein
MLLAMMVILFMATRLWMGAKIRHPKLGKWL